MKAQSRLFVVTLVCVITRETVATSRIKSVNGLVTWSQAEEECNKNGNGFMLPSHNTTQSDIEREMTKNRHKEVWLNLKRKQLDTWEWVDGLPVDGGFVQGNWKETQNCGIFHLRDRTLEADACSKTNYGIICRHEGNCTSFNGSRANCMDDVNSSLIFVGHANNWFDARYRCSQRNLTFAVVRNEALMDRLYQQWYLNHRKRPMQVWVGLRRQEWISDSYTRNKVFETYWAPDQPSQDGNCTLLSRNSLGRFQWKAASCNSSHKALCVRVTEHTVGTGESPRENNVSTEKGNTTLITVVCAAVGGVIVLGVGIGIICLCRRKHSNRGKRSREKDMNVSKKETIPLRREMECGSTSSRPEKATNSRETETISTGKSDGENSQNVRSDRAGNSNHQDTEDSVSGQNASKKEAVKNKAGVAAQDAQNKKVGPQGRLDSQNESPRVKGLLAGYEKYDVDNKKTEYKPGDTLEIKELDISLEVPAGNTSPTSDKMLKIRMEGYRDQHNMKPVIVKLQVKGKSTADLKLRIPTPAGQHDKAELVASESESKPWIAPNTYYVKCTYTPENAKISLKTPLKYHFFMINLKQ